MLELLFWSIYVGVLAEMVIRFAMSCICMNDGHKRVNGVCMRCLNIGKAPMIIPEVFATETLAYGVGTINENFRTLRNINQIRDANEEMMYTTFEYTRPPRPIPYADTQATVTRVDNPGTNTPVETTTINATQRTFMPGRQMGNTHAMRRTLDAIEARLARDTTGPNGVPPVPRQAPIGVAGTPNPLNNRPFTDRMMRARIERGLAATQTAAQDQQAANIGDITVNVDGQEPPAGT
jgi:hypothetical protein